MVAQCIAACNNDYIGYSQARRNTLHVQAANCRYDLGSIKTPCDTDCSAFMTCCAIAGGVTKLEYSLGAGGNAPTTSTMINAFRNAGFQVYTDPKYLKGNAELMPGDILVKSGSHTVMNLGLGANVALKPVLPQAVTGSARQVIEFCMGKGLNFAAGCAIAANIEHESGYRTDAKGDKRKGVYTSFGLCQWHNNRGTQMINFVGEDWETNFTGQMEYLWTELLGGYKRVYNVMSSVPNTEDGLITATDKWISSYEIPAGYDDKNSSVYKTRRATARRIFSTGVS